MATTTPPLALPVGVTARGATPDDVAAALSVTVAAERDLGLDTLTTHDDIAGDWARPSMDVGRQVLLLEQDGRTIGYGETHGTRAFAHVLPDERGRGLGSALATWIAATAAADGHDHVRQVVPAVATRAASLLADHGWEARWESWILHRALESADADGPAPPGGVVVRAARLPAEDAEVHRVVTLAFGTWPDAGPASTLEDYRAASLDRAATDGVVLVAEDHGRVVGAAVGAVDDDTGWVDALAVDPAHWRRGLGGLLLRRAFAVYRDRGLPRVALSTDSRTGALGLYQRHGMAITETYTSWVLPLGRTGGGA